MSERLGEGRIDKGGVKGPPATERPSWLVYGQKLSGYQRPDEQELAKAIRVLKAKEAVCDAAKVMYLTPEGERLSYIRQLGSLMLLVEALIEAQNS